MFLRHLVAAGREIDPEFGSDTLELILGLGAGGPSQADVVASIVREYGDFAAQIPEGLTLIVDDHHVIDGSAETDRILRALIDRTGNGFSIVIASRSAPRLPLGGLRSRGGLSRLDGADLRFDVPETDRLFREAYQRPLDPDVVDQLIRRTEGWAALLMLVRTSLEDKAAPEARALVAQLSAARGDLYDFLAEEVLASLSPALTHFLTRVSVLVSVDPETGALVVDRPASEVAGLIGEAEALGLLSRPDREAPHRFHPLGPRLPRRPPRLGDRHRRGARPAPPRRASPRTHRLVRRRLALPRRRPTRRRRPRHRRRAPEHPRARHGRVEQSNSSTATAGDRGPARCTGP